MEGNKMNSIIEPEQIELNDEFIYQVFDVLVEGGSDGAVGKIRLYNLNTKELDTYTIWEGDPEVGWYYVCIPTGSNGDLEEYDVGETFSINPIIFNEEDETK